jgi:DNA-binding PadR family transcriptional regulator
VAPQLNATAASLLGFLHAGPMTGWDLVTTAETLIGDFWSLTRSQVYRELASMADAGLVKAGATGPRERRPYRLTPSGRAAFRAWLQREPGPELIRFPLLLTVGFGRHLPPEKLAAYVATHRARHAKRLSEFEAVWPAVRDDGDPYLTATLDFGIRYERMVLEWFDALPQEIADP